MKIISAFILLTFLFSCSTNPSNNRPPLPRQIKAENRVCENYITDDESVTANKYASAGALLIDFYKTAPYKDSLELNIWLGIFHYYKQNFDSALYYQLEAKKIDSSDAKIHFDLALTYCGLNDFTSALNSTNRALSICGDKWEYLNSKCYILGMLHRCDESVTIGLNSLNLNPENKKIYGNLLRCFDELGQKDSVIKYLKIAEDKYGVDLNRSELIQKIKAKYQ